MSTTQANRTTMAFGVEPSAQTEPSSTPATFYLSPNSGGITANPTPDRIARDPIGPSPMAEAGTVIRTNAQVTYGCDFTRDNFLAFVEGALRCALSTSPRIFYPTEVRSTDYVVSANGALAQYTLIVARGFATAANNGFKVVGAGSDGTHIVASGLTAETLTSGQGATVEVCGYQGASGDLAIDADGNLTSSVLDFTTLPLSVGQRIWIGGDSSGTKFATASDRGEARITVIAANKLTLDDKVSGTLATADNGSGKTVQLFYGRFAKVSATTAAAYVERTYQIELGHGTLSAGSAAYEYFTGCSVMTWALSAPTAAKATMQVNFDAQATVDPTASRRTSFSAPIAQNAKALMNTLNHIRRSVVRQSTTALTGYITGLDLSIATGAMRNEAHGQQGSVLTTYGDIDITATAQAFFSTTELIPALLSDTLCNGLWSLRCGGTTSSTDTWGVAFDIPGLQITTAPRTIDPNKPTAVAIGLKAVRDPTYNTLLMVSDFPYLPAP